MDYEQLASLIRRSLRRSRRVEIDGLGVFKRGDTGSVSFKQDNRLRIFIAYASEDFAIADKLFLALRDRGYAPWIDRKRLLPGQNWPLRIHEAIASADFFLACFSSNSVKKRGGFQTELRYALECARRIPMDDVFLIPVRLNVCRLPAQIHLQTQYVDMFPDFDAGMDRIAATLESWRKDAA